ncbi:aspartate carbamoyltransferase regulatory subunit [Abyssisolibacter fermentans]|uniref:aspartate carbamoyltransferase regulatory subunit n=1 Tax=Abyssisolibacter fermentans TaxID=1766203 RepID=UPI000832DB42|nr:aspartate carbamoyltransferase regulatory subunit [Abyssisolibacter fermentans]
MLTVNSIKNGIVIDHIKSGNGLKIFEKLNLTKVDYPVVLLMNVESDKLEKKDIIKIQDKIDVDLAMLGLIDPNITVNIIKNGQRIEKRKVGVPQKVKGLFKCSNPRCISNHDLYVEPSFNLIDEEKVKYQCEYCDDFTEYRI